MKEQDFVELANYILSAENNDPKVDRKRFQTLISTTEQICEKEKTNLDFPVRVLWKITGLCNCKCKHCWAKLGGSTSGQNLRDLANEIAEHRPIIVSLSGGEPLLCRDYFEIYRILKSKNIIVETLTNGSLITEKWIEKYKKIADINIDVIQISLDGSTPALHDTQRGVSVFDKAVNSIRALKRNGIKVRVSFTATELNQTDIYNTYCLCNSLGVDVMSITPVFPLRKGRELANVLDENIYLHEVLRCKRNELNTKTRVQVGFEFRNLIWKYRNNPKIKDLLKGEDNKTYFFMQETNTSVQIDAYGNAIPGPEYENCHAAGDVYQKTLQAVWRLGKNWEEFRAGRNFEYVKCSNCDIFSICCGGNAKMAYDVYGTINAPDGRCKLNELAI